MSTPQTTKRQLPTVLVATLAIAATLVAVVALLSGRSTEASFTSSADAGFDVTASKPGGGKILALPQHKLDLSPEGVLTWVEGQHSGTDISGDEIRRCGDLASVAVDDIDGWAHGESGASSTAYARSLEGDSYEVDVLTTCLVPVDGLVVGPGGSIPAYGISSSVSSEYRLTVRSISVDGIDTYEIEAATFSLSGDLVGSLKRESVAPQSNGGLYYRHTTGSIARGAAVRARGVLSSGEVTAWSDIYASVRSTNTSYTEDDLRNIFGAGPETAVFVQH